MNIMNNIQLVAVIAIVSSASILVHVDQVYALTSLIDEAKEKGLPYLTSVQVKDDVLKLDDKSLLVLQVDFHSKNNTDIWIDIKPVIEKQFILYHKVGFSTATGIDEPYGGEIKNQHRIQDYVEYDDSVIRLNSNESKQIPVHVEVPVKYLGKFQNQPLPISVGFELVDSNMLEKLPRYLENLEIQFESLSDKKIQNPIDFNSYKTFHLSPLKQIQSGVPIDEIQCKDGLVQVFKQSNNSPACVTLQAKAKLMERGWAEPLDGVVFQRSAYPEPPPVSKSDLQLHNAKKLLESAYYENVNLGPLKINDVILGLA